MRTPLTSLIGYLEAVDEDYIAEALKSEYIRAATHKAHDLKSLTDMLFDWFKLDSQEISFCFEQNALCELTQTVVADFIPMLEKGGSDTVRTAKSSWLGLSITNAHAHGGSAEVASTKGRTALLHCVCQNSRER